MSYPGMVLDFFCLNVVRSRVRSPGTRRLRSGRSGCWCPRCTSWVWTRSRSSSGLRWGGSYSKYQPLPISVHVLGFSFFYVFIFFSMCLWLWLVWIVVNGWFCWVETWVLDLMIVLFNPYLSLSPHPFPRCLIFMYCCYTADVDFCCTVLCFMSVPVPFPVSFWHR